MYCQYLSMQYYANTYFIYDDDDEMKKFLRCHNF
jgi:hypothetical protein